MKMSRPKIGVVIHTELRQQLFSPSDVERMNSLGEVVWTDSPKPITVAQACQLLAGCEVGVGSWGTPHPCKEIMDACPNLRFWEHVAGTVKHMFGPHLKGRDFTIASCKTAIADGVAEVTLGEIILGLKRIVQDIEAGRRGKGPKQPGMKPMAGSVIAVVGASEVGKRVLKLLKAFRCKVLLYDPFVTPARAKKMGAELVGDLLDLCRRSDVVTLHAPALPQTAKMLNAAHFQAMKDDCVFINTARGMCIDEAALIAELQKGRLTAFLDVSDPEPAADDSPLRRLPNSFYTSHIAGPVAFNLGAQATSDVAAFLSGKKPMCVVTKRVLYKTA
jgi:phosphoglycerate dehydrogenase-like enzyme